MHDLQAGLAELKQKQETHKDDMLVSAENPAGSGPVSELNASVLDGAVAWRQAFQLTLRLEREAAAGVKAGRGITPMGSLMEAPYLRHVPSEQYRCWPLAILWCWWC